MTISSFARRSTWQCSSHHVMIMSNHDTHQLCTLVIIYMLLIFKRLYAASRFTLYYLIMIYEIHTDSSSWRYSRTISILYAAMAVVCMQLCLHFHGSWIKGVSTGGCTLLSALQIIVVYPRSYI